MANKHATLASLFTDIADSLRTKTGRTDNIVADDFPDVIDDILSPTDGTIPTVAMATPDVDVSSGGLITVESVQSEGYVSGGVKTVTEQLSTQTTATITPGTSAKTAVAAGKYTTGEVTVAGDSNLVAANIASGKTIFGVSGSAVLASSLPNAEEVKF